MDMVVPEKAPENVSTALELKDLSYTNVKSVPTKSPQPPLTNEAGLHVSSEYDPFLFRTFVSIMCLFMLSIFNYKISTKPKWELFKKMDDLLAILKNLSRLDLALWYALF